MNGIGGSAKGNSKPVGSSRVPAGNGAGASRPGNPAKMPPGRVWMWFAIALLLNYTVMNVFMPNPDAPVTVPYTLFKEEVTKRNVERIYSRGESLTGQFRTPVTYPGPADTAADAKVRAQ